MSIVVIATLECFIGASLIAGRFMRLAIWLLAIEFVGILSPLVLLPGRLSAGPRGAPTLEGQYVLKDVILVGAAMVIAAATLRGGRLVRGDLAPASLVRVNVPLDGEQKLSLMLDGTDPDLIAQICKQYGVSELDIHHWREIASAGAAQALDQTATTESAADVA